MHALGSDCSVTTEISCAQGHGGISQTAPMRHDASRMIRFGRSIRLTLRETERLHRITGIEPAGIRTLDDLRAYAGRCKEHYWGVSKDTQFLHWLIDREVERCLQAA